MRLGGPIITERGNAPSEPDVFPSQSWEPNWVDGTLYAQAACGKHFGNYLPEQVKAGDVPCKSGCASIGFTS